MAYPTIRCLTASNAAALDRELFTSFSFSLDQLMELAGLSVAEAVFRVYPFSDVSSRKNRRRVLLVCGPGNNGGDGLVAARHLYHFGYQPRVCYPKPGKAEFFKKLVTQLETLDVPFVPSEDLKHELSAADLIVDSIFGFSFASGTIREPFNTIIKQIKETACLPRSSRPSIISVDIPSGWDVNAGPPADDDIAILPDVLVSLTAPKPFVSHIKTGRHFLGGRFLPPVLGRRYGLVDLPPCQAPSQIVELSVPIRVDVAPDPTPEEGAEEEAK